MEGRREWGGWGAVGPKSRSDDAGGERATRGRGRKKRQRQRQRQRCVVAGSGQITVNQIAPH